MSKEKVCRLYVSGIAGCIYYIETWRSRNWREIVKDISAQVAYISEPDVKSVFEHSAASNIQQENKGGDCSIIALRNLRDSWKDEGSIVVFTAGVFDILHTSHLLALTHYRLLGAHEYWVRQGVNNPSIEQLHEIAASDKVRFILSVDTDSRVAGDKAFIPEKGNSPKPLVSWENRTLLLARQSISGKNNSRNLIDFITSHGADACICDDCPRNDNAHIAAAIKPDVIVVSSGSQGTIDKLREHDSELSNANLVIIKEDNLSYHDKLLQGPIKSSSIIKRAQLKPQH